MNHNAVFNRNKKIGLLLLLLAICLIGAGLYKGQQSSVMIKAINICLECVGIG